MPRLEPGQGSPPRSLAYRLLARLGGEGFANELFSPRLLFAYLFVQKLTRRNAGAAWPVHPTTTIRHVQRMTVGRSCPGMSPNCYLQAVNGIEVGDNVRIGPGVGIISANHDLLDFDEHVGADPVVVGDDCWLGMNSILLPGVTLGSHVVVAAGSVVTKSFPDNVVIAGNPARQVSRLEVYGGGGGPRTGQGDRHDS